jgi:hypothetical protein
MPDTQYRMKIHIHMGGYTGAETSGGYTVAETVADIQQQIQQLIYNTADTVANIQWQIQWQIHNSRSTAVDTQRQIQSSGYQHGINSSRYIAEDTVADI